MLYWQCQLGIEESLGIPSSWIIKKVLRQYIYVSQMYLLVKVWPTAITIEYSIIADCKQGSKASWKNISKTNNQIKFINHKIAELYLMFHHNGV